MKVAILGILLICGSVVSVQAASLSWDPLNDASVTGFNLYQATGACVSSSVFTKVTTYPGATTVTGVIPKPALNGLYCFRITAYNDAGESAPSNNVEVRLTVVPPTAPQKLTVKP